MPSVFNLTLSFVVHTTVDISPTMKDYSRACFKRLVAITGLMGPFFGTKCSAYREEGVRVELVLYVCPVRPHSSRVKCDRSHIGHTLVVDAWSSMSFV